MFTKDKQISEAYGTGIALAIAGGFLDAYTYVSRGGVFANAQTGNMVFFAIYIAQGKLYTALLYFIPIFAFIIGIFISEYIRKLHNTTASTLFHWRQSIVLAEAIILTAIAFVPSGRADTAVNVLISLVCSLQVESFRKINGNPVATTMCTGNLRSGSENIYKYQATGDRTFLKKGIQYYGIILFFILGSILGTIATSLLHIKAIFICVFILLVIFILMFINNDKAS